MKEWERGLTNRMQQRASWWRENASSSDEAQLCRLLDRQEAQINELNAALRIHEAQYAELEAQRGALPVEEQQQEAFRRGAEWYMSEGFHLSEMHDGPKCKQVWICHAHGPEQP